MGIQLNGITGDAIIPGDVGIGGTLTYEDVTNVDSLGVGTFRDGLRVVGICTADEFHGDGANLTGVSGFATVLSTCLLYTSPSPRDRTRSRMPSSA